MLVGLHIENDLVATHLNQKYGETHLYELYGLSVDDVLDQPFSWSYCGGHPIKRVEAPKNQTIWSLAYFGVGLGRLNHIIEWADLADQSNNLFKPLDIQILGPLSITH